MLSSHLPVDGVSEQHIVLFAGIDLLGGGAAGFRQVTQALLIGL